MSKKDKIEIPDQVGNENRGELDSKVVCANFAHTTPHGAIKGKMQISEVVLYNLDVIISVGYRVKSIAGTRFRQWANCGIKECYRKTSRRKLAGTNSHKSFLLQKRFLPVKASLYQKALVNQSHFFVF